MVAGPRSHGSGFQGTGGAPTGRHEHQRHVRRLDVAPGRPAGGEMPGSPSAALAGLGGFLPVDLRGEGPAGQDSLWSAGLGADANTRPCPPTARTE